MPCLHTHLPCPANSSGLHGARVVITGRRAAVLEETCAALGAEGVMAHHVAGDVRKPVDCEQMVSAAVARFGRLDILINCAAGNFLAAAEQLSPNGFRTVMEIDAVGVGLVLQLCERIV